MGRLTPKARATTATDLPPSSQSTTAAREQSGVGESATTARRVRRSSGDKKDRTQPPRREITPPKCKAHAQNYTRPWFPAFLADALASADVTGACARADVTLLDLHRLRASDPAADAACLELDQIAGLLARQAVVYAAASGDLKAIRALTDGSLNAIGLPDNSTIRPTAGGAWLLCPHCNSTLLVTGHIESYSKALILQTIHPRDVAWAIERTHLTVPPVPAYLVEYFKTERWDGAEAHEPQDQPQCHAKPEATTAARHPVTGAGIPISR